MPRFAVAWLVATFASIILAAEPDFAPCLDETLTPGCPGTIQWDGGAGTTAWATGINWSTDVVPGTSDDVCIPELGAGVEVVHSAGTDAVNSIAGAGGLQVSGGTLSTAVDSPGIGQLVLSGGTLALTGTLPVAGGFSWTGGTLTGSGSTTVSGGSLTSGTFKDLTGGRILQTSGTTVWSGTGSIRLDGGSSLQNAGTWDNQGNAVLLDLGTGGGFANPAGSTFRKSAGGATTSFQVPFTNGGTVAVENATLSLDGGGTATGAFTGSAGTTLRFGGGTHGLGSASSVSAATVAVTGGSVTVDGAYAATTTTVSAGTLTFNPAATVSGIGALSVSNTGTLTLNSGEAIAPPTLSFTNGTIGGSDPLSVSGAFTWSGGALTGNAATTAPMGIAISSGTFKELTGGRTLSTGGTTTWAGTGSIRLGSGGSIQNGGIWDIQGNATMVLLTGGGGFTNPVTRTLRKSAGGGLTTFDVAVTNEGSVSVESGTLSLDAGSTSTGSFTGGPGTTLRFGGGTHGLGNASSVSAATVAVAAGSVTVDGTYAATATAVSGGTLTVNPSATVSSLGALSVSNTGTVTLNSGEAVALPTLSFTNGAIGGSDALSVSGAFTWSGGTLSGNAAVTAPMGIAISSGTFKDLTGGRTLSTGGTTTWSGTGSIRLGSGGNIQNAGIWDVQGNATMAFLAGGGGFTNPATRTMRKSAGGGLTTFDVAVTNGGTVAVESGTLSLDAGSTSSGAYNGTPGTTLRFGGGMHDLGSASSVSAATVAVTSGSVTVDGTYTATSTMVSAGTLTFSPSATVSAIGALSVSGTGTLTLNSGEAITPPTLSVTNGTIGGSDAVSVSGTFTWSGGTLTGNGTTTAPMGIAISSGTFKDLTGGRTLSTSGSIDWTGSGSVRVGGGAKIINNGTWTLQSDAFLSDLGSAGTFANTSGATFRKAAGAGTSQIVVPFTNAGTVRASAGTLQFGSSYTQTAGTTLLDGGTLAGTGPLLLQGGTLTGSGTVAGPVNNTGGTVAPGQSAGTLSLGGIYTQGAAATLAIELGGLSPGTQHDRVDVAGATTLGGTLQVSLINGFVPAAGSTFTVLTFPSSTGTFSASNLPPLPNIVWLVRYNPTSVVLEAAGDQDEDGTPNGSDCAPSDPTAWGVPAEVTGASFGANKQTLSWSSQAISAGPSITYDVVRGAVALLPVGSGGETCLTPGTATAQTSDATLPAVGTGSYYLVRARNVCAVGTYGTRTGGVPRTTAACP